MTMATSSEILVPAIPDDIHRRFLKFLPLASLCRFRCVSKVWRSAIAATITTSPKPSFLSVAINGFVRICYGSKWSHIGHPFALPAADPQEMTHHFNFVSTSGGLVLVTHGRLLSTCWLSVHNPLAPSCGRVLKPLADIHGLRYRSLGRLVFTGIQASPIEYGNISFAVVCVTEAADPGGVLVHVFDSVSWSWVVECARLPAPIDEVLCYGPNNFNPLLLSNGRLHFVTISKGSNSRSLNSIDIWNPENSCTTLATWRDLPLGLHQNSSQEHCSASHPSLVHCQGKLMLVGVIPDPPRYGSLGFVYLDEEAREWRKLASFPVLSLMPEEAKRQYEERRVEPRHVYVWADGELGSSKLALYSPIGWEWGCVFDLTDATWHEAVCQPYHFRPTFLTFQNSAATK